MHPSRSKPSSSVIQNPRRLFIISANSHSLSTVPDLLYSLTGTPVGDLPQDTTDNNTNDNSTSSPTTSSQSTFAGYTSHPPLPIRTKYYNADVPIWVDEIPLPTVTTTTTTAIASTSSPSSPDTPSTEQWRSEFLSSEAQIVRDAIGAVVVCLRNPEITSTTTIEDPDHATRRDVKAIKEFLRAVGDVRSRAEEERGGDAEIPGLLVFVNKDGTKANRDGNGSLHDNEEENGIELAEDEDGGKPFSAGWWEDQLFDDGLMGFEVICWDPTVKEEEKRNQFGGKFISSPLEGRMNS